MCATPVMAQHAMDIYDHRGEFAMLPYIMNNATPHQSNEEWLKTGQLHLRDGSTINHRKYAYSFSWQEDGEHRAHQRPAAMPVDGRPDVSDQAPNPYG